MTEPTDAPVTLWTVGHSNRSLEELAELLTGARIRSLVDVRRYPGSRRHPHFDRASLLVELPRRGVGYAHAAELGGHREPRADSLNRALEDDGLRGYADHMEGAAFRRAVEILLRAARSVPTAVMCAEREFARCHRGLLSDFLVNRGVAVRHLVAPGEVREHGLDLRARPTEEGGLCYPLPEEQLELFPGEHAAG